MGIKDTYIDGAAVCLRENLGKERAERVMEEAKKRWLVMFEENKDELPGVKVHSHDRIYPAVAIFLTLIDDGMPRNEAAALLNEYYLKRNEPEGERIREELRENGLYRQIPQDFAAMTRRVFGEGAGSKIKWYETGEEEMRFDMLTCPFNDICRRYDAAELLYGFCESDVVCYGSMHPKVIWKRTKTLGAGDDLCDFHIWVED